MAGGYEVVLEAISAASEAAKRAAEDVGRVNLAAALAGVSAGLPGGVSGEAARLLADAWGRAAPGWAKNASEYSGQLGEAAVRYRSNELAASRELHV
ncbi:hypothetical protein [Amycolatopsis regifaucium]|uniref:ESX-1 secretion-associated protein n=1 Tax=Amycolatopsis regifaucium TaxID=546365 RepID=A0A154MK05_9PSEU|nr:hypothetical protein [Amycolatopsis regifaucium]KZB84655.1 hypothetical protein AVL48_33310 [Amycolatopsis regifaucium]OKA11119.1 hypothetical protein ATP06_0202975 [Amycolatopsis regifaucium]SFI29148.1 hypothetical protein SAMN04489731_109342 [Amycolatopsis regifaucium]